MMLPSHVTYAVLMGRWEPGTRERLVRAALDLFGERSYEATTVNEIAERAGGLTKTTFFRHFTDKREVLFAGQEIHARVLAEAIAASPETAAPLEAMATAVDALAGTFTDDRPELTDDRREFAARVRTVIATNGELQERAAFKRMKLAEAATTALRERGVPEPTADLAAELGIRAFYRAFDRWTEPDNQRDLADLAEQALRELRSAAATLG